MPHVSAFVITLNEAKNIEECLDGLSFCDDVLVLDSGSTDGTAELARAKGARVEYHPFAGFGPQQNIALAMVAGDWIIYLDADERVTPALAAEIKAAIAKGDADAYAMPRLSSFCGRQMRHSGWWPDYVTRVYRRGKARFSEDIVHPRVLCDGKVVRLREPIVHHPVLRIEDALSRMDRYSTASARQYVERGRRIGFATGIVHGLFTFFKVFFLRAGFLDGREGFLLAVVNAEGTYYKYMKAWLAGRRRD